MINMCKNCIHMNICQYKDDLQNKVEMLKEKLESYRTEINNITCGSGDNADVYADFSVDATVTCRYFLKSL